MKEYDVTLPIAGYVSLHVTAENEETALENALNSNITTKNIVEWDAYKRIVDGNVFHGPQNEYEIDEIKGGG